MKIRTQFCAGLLLSLLAAGCQPESAKQAHTSVDEPATHELFNKSKGVHLPNEMRRELALATVEVTQRSVARHLHKAAQVYRAAQGATLAAATTWLSEAEAKQVRLGQTGTLSATGQSPQGTHTPPGGERTFAGKLVRLVEQSFGAQDEVEALLEFGDPAGQFPVGASLVATFAGATSDPTLAVPESAVIHGAAGTFVYAANGEHFARTPVKLGAVADGWAEVLDGLYEGDVIASQAADSLWLIELCALKGGTPCCPVPTKKSDK